MTSGINERPYLSIGEVLGLLLEEFPDVTISKIRFLESQGLIEPERTASGYRKFFDADVERLKVILREQRENFLPLRVIRDRLENRAIDDGGVTSPSRSAPRGLRNVRLADLDHPPSLDEVAPRPPSRPAPPPPIPSDDTDGLDIDATGQVSPFADLVQTGRHPAAQLRPAPPLARPAPDSPDSAVADVPPPAAVTPADTPAGATSVTPTSSAASSASTPGAMYMRSDVCAAAGITSAQLAELESFGLVTGRGTGSNATYTESDLAIVRAAAGFLARGIDARHLRPWRQSAEREASLFEQRILPLLRQRNPQARQDAIELLHQLADLGAQLREAIVMSTLRQHLDS